MVFVCPGELKLHLIDAVKLIDGDFDSRTTSMQTLLCEGMLKYATEYETGYNGRRRLYSCVVYPAVRAGALKIYRGGTQVSITQYLHDRYGFTISYPDLPLAEIDSGLLN